MQVLVRVIEFLCGFGFYKLFFLQTLGFVAQCRLFVGKLGLHFENFLKMHYFGKFHEFVKKINGFGEFSLLFAKVCVFSWFIIAVTSVS